MPSADNANGIAGTVPPSQLPQVACVVTAFHPSPQLVDNVRALLAQSGSVVVVDDGGGPGFESVFERVAAAGAIVISLPENSGIAAALNSGIRKAREDSRVRYIITVDQDSLLPQGYVKSLLAGERSARARGLVPGLISPARIHGNPVMSRGSHNGIALAKEPIQSGLMITTDALSDLGDFREELFIDLVDTEYYLRATDAGWPTVLADAEFDHSLGTFVEARIGGQSIRLGGQPLKVRIAASWRYYYIFRNRLLVSRNYARRHPAWVTAGCFADLRHLAIVTMLAPGRRARLTAALAGVKDGLRGLTGKKPGT